jgi:hypothetical protein
MKKIIDFTETNPNSEQLVGPPSMDMKVVQEQNEALGKHLFAYFQEICDIQNVESVELTKEGQEMVNNAAKLLVYVTHNHMVTGPSSGALIN